MGKRILCILGLHKWYVRTAPWPYNYPSGVEGSKWCYYCDATRKGVNR